MFLDKYFFNTEVILIDKEYNNMNDVVSSLIKFFVNARLNRKMPDLVPSTAQVGKPFGSGATSDF